MRIGPVEHIPRDRGFGTRGGRFKSGFTPEGQKFPRFISVSGTIVHYPYDGIAVAVRARGGAVRLARGPLQPARHVQIIFAHSRILIHDPLKQGVRFHEISMRLPSLKNTVFLGLRHVTFWVRRKSLYATF